MQKLSQLIRGEDLVVAPVALNPIMARMAEEAGFKAVYLSGGSLGWYKCVTEANITLPEMAQVAVDMRAACRLPIVLDAGGGWGDPMHVHRTIALSEAAGFAAIEIEDQLLPRRVEHHVGIEHLVPTEFMVEKVEGGDRRAHRSRFRHHRPHQCAAPPRPRRGACAGARRSRRPAPTCCSCTRATPRRCASIGERLPPPLMTFAPPDGFADFPLKENDLAALGYRLAASSGTAFAAMVKAVRQSYECLAQGRIDPFIGKGNVEKEMKAAHGDHRPRPAAGDRAAHHEVAASQIAELKRPASGPSGGGRRAFRRSQD